MSTFTFFRIVNFFSIFILLPFKINKSVCVLGNESIGIEISSKSILDIHLLFVDTSQSNNSHIIMGTLFKPLDYSVVIGQPHNIPDKAIEKVPSFYGNDAITAKSRLLAFTQCYNK